MPSAILINSAVWSIALNNTLMHILQKGLLLWTVFTTYTMHHQYFPEGLGPGDRYPQWGLAQDPSRGLSNKGFVYQ